MSPPVPAGFVFLPSPSLLLTFALFSLAFSFFAAAFSPEDFAISFVLGGIVNAELEHRKRDTTVGVSSDSGYFVGQCPHPGQVWAKCSFAVRGRNGFRSGATPSNSLVC